MNIFRCLLGFAVACLLVSPSLEAGQSQTFSLPQELSSSSALLVDLHTNQILYSSNADRQRPIASVTKLMAAVVLLDGGQSMSQLIPVAIRSNPSLQGVYSRVHVGSLVSRRNMLLMALMSSENRAANSLAENYPGGMPAFVAAMNAKARALGMTRTHYAEPTGLSAANVSSANDLMKLLKATRNYPLIGQLSRTPFRVVSFTRPAYSLTFNNTNRLTRNPDWDVELTKTGFTNPAGHCLVMRTHMDGRLVGYVGLNAYGKQTHVADAARLRNWLETGERSPLPGNLRRDRGEQVATQGGSSIKIRWSR